MNLTVHLYPMPRFRISGNIPLLSLYAFSVWTEGALPLPFLIGDI
jgi:hypothetical protein